jgi:hypothetical protein
VGRATNVASTGISPIEFHARAWVRRHDQGGELSGQSTVYVRVGRAFDGANISDLANGAGCIVGLAGRVCRKGAGVGRSINNDLFNVAMGSDRW